MKTIKIFFCVLILSSVVGCDQIAVMKVYGDNEKLDAALEHLTRAFAENDKIMMIGSKYEVPDLVIVNGDVALKQVTKVYGDFQEIKDSTQFDIIIKEKGREKIVFVFGKDESETIRGILFLTDNLERNGSLVDGLRMFE